MSSYSPPIPMEQVDSKPKADEKVDYSNLPCPNPYEELHRESNMCLRPELFEGFRVSYTKMLNQKFYLTHNVSMGPTEVPTQSTDVIKVPTSNYEFGAIYADPKLTLVGRVMTDGKLSLRVRRELTDNVTIGASGQISNEDTMSFGTATFDYKGSDYRTQLQFGSGSLLTANYLQHVTPQLAFGGEVFWSGDKRKSGVGYAARYETDKMIASGQVGSTGLATMNYVQKVSDKVSLATEIMYNYITRDVLASAGYDYILRQSRLRAKIDSNGASSAYLEQRLPIGLNIVMSGEVDHMRKDYKFGFGVNN